ncbi:unnamed protein product [Amoebophrya sp. A25]|nr:unnamed protein product [Amoebophrya sp. A25]|eukprot:GSA25T00005600001.1
MSYLTIVAPGRFLDGIVVSFFVMVVAGLSLFVFGTFHHYVCVSEAKKLGMVAVVFDKIFPMPGKKWAFNLTHTLLLSILISLQSMMHHPAQDYLEENAILQKKKREKAEAKEEKGGKEA